MNIGIDDDDSYSQKVPFDIVNMVLTSKRLDSATKEPKTFRVIPSLNPLILGS